MATRGTTQYNVWKAKFDAARLRKQGQNSLFSEEQVNTLISEVISNFKPVETHTKEYFLSNMPSNLRFDLWERATIKATKNGSKEAAFGSVRAIYNAYHKRLIEGMRFSTRRAENERQLSEMFI